MIILNRGEGNHIVQRTEWLPWVAEVNQCDGDKGEAGWAGSSVLRDEDAEQMGRHQATGLVHPPPRGMHLYFS